MSYTIKKATRKVKSKISCSLKILKLHYLKNQPIYIIILKVFKNKGEIISKGFVL